MGEWERISRLRALHQHSAGAPLLGIGDDAAVLHADSRPTVLSCDSSVEGVHFKRDFADWRLLSRRAVVAALSDLCAMGASPRALLSSLVLPSALDENAFDEISAGIADAARECGAPVVGGNLTKGPAVVIDTTVVGALEGDALTRAGAQIGDGIFVFGFPGAAALGLQALLRNDTSDVLQPYRTTWLHPNADFEQAYALVGHASACVDISDGLVQDLGHLCAASGVGALLELESIPRAPDFARAAQSLECNERELLLSGGEAYELLFTSASDSLGTRIGTVEEQTGVRVRHAKKIKAESMAGHDHFPP